MGRGLLRTRRQWRLERKRELAFKGVKATRIHRIHAVRITAIPMPEWVRERAIPHLSFSESFAWLRRRDAWLLMRADRDAGGQPYSTETEFRLCPVCGRPLIGDDARMRRDLDESCMTGRQIPCGSECLDAARDRRWRVK
jgi:hypothetical protein